MDGDAAAVKDSQLGVELQALHGDVKVTAAALLGGSQDEQVLAFQWDWLLSILQMGLTPQPPRMSTTSFCPMRTKCG